MAHFIQSPTDYMVWTETAAIYPKTKEEEYLKLGLLGECGEVAQMLKKKVRDSFYQFTREDMLHELGDIIWYATRMHYGHGTCATDIEIDVAEKILDEFGLTLSDTDNQISCMKIGLSVFDHFYHRAKTETIIDFLGIDKKELGELDLPTKEQVLEALNLKDAYEKLTVLSLKVSKFQARQAEIYSSMLRLVKAKEIILLEHIIEQQDSPYQFMAWAALCDRFQFTPLEVMQANFDKIESRKARGKIQGSGDNR